MAGRPSVFTQDIADDICNRIASGESLRAICRDENMPAEVTVRGWVQKDWEGFSAQYARAREIQFQSMADEIMEISDDGSNDWMARNKNGSVTYELNGEHVQRSRIRVDCRKWLLSKMLPKVYGDKSEVALTGANGGPVQSVSVVTTDPVEAARLYQQLVGGDQ